MDHITRWWIAAASAASLSLNTAQAHSVPCDMVVRLYNIADLPQADIAASKRVVEHIFRRAGIEVLWRECVALAVAAVDDVCMERVQPREFIGRIVRGGQRSPVRVFGQALIIDGHTSTMATIFADRITVATVRLDVDRATLLGRTLAHELGHLLLGTNSHAAYGLMRGLWPDAAMRSDTGHQWNFSNREAQRMKLALVRRTEASQRNRDLQALSAPSARDPS